MLRMVSLQVSNTKQTKPIFMFALQQCFTIAMKSLIGSWIVDSKLNPTITKTLLSKQVDVSNDLNEGSSFESEWCHRHRSGFI